MFLHMVALPWVTPASPWGAEEGLVVGITSSRLPSNHVGGALTAFCAAAGTITPSRGSGLTRKTKAGWIHPGAHFFMQTYNLAPHGFSKVLVMRAVQRDLSC